MKQPRASRYRLRRLLQFRLRTLLALLLLSSLAMGWWRHYMQGYHEQQEALAAVAQHVQHVVFAPGRPTWMRHFTDDKVFKDVVHISFQSKRKFTNEHIVHLAKMPRLSRLSLQNTSISDDGLQALSNLEQLDTVSLESTQVTDKGLQHLSDLGKLRMLQLNRTQVTGKGLRHLTNLRSLKRLEMANAHVRDEDVALLREMQQLTELQMYIAGSGSGSGSRLTLSALDELESLTLHCAAGHPLHSSNIDVYVEHLPKLKSFSIQSNTYHNLILNDLPQLSRLSITGGLSSRTRFESLPRVTELRLENRTLLTATMKTVAALPNLQALYLSGSTIPADGWQHLRDLQSIRELQLSYTGMQGQDLQYLSDLETLRTLTLAHNHIRGEDLVHLQRLSELRLLDLDQTDCFTSKLADDHGFGYLRHSALFSPAFSDGNGIKHLLALTMLEHLTLVGTDVTYDDAAQLSKLPRLKVLQLQSVWSRAQSDSLRRLFPTTNVSQTDPIAAYNHRGNWRRFQYPYVPEEHEMSEVEQMQRWLRQQRIQLKARLRVRGSGS